MIVSFGSKETRLIWEGQLVSSFMPDFQLTIRQKLKMIDRSVVLMDLIHPPSNRLEKLRGNLEGFYSVRINRQWRIIFRWMDGHAEDVEIIDYH